MKLLLVHLLAALNFSNVFRHKNPMADVAMWCVEYPTMTRPAGGRHRAHLVDSSRTASADDDGVTAAAMNVDGVTTAVMSAVQRRQCDHGSDVGGSTSTVWPRQRCRRFSVELRCSCPGLTRLGDARASHSRRQSPNRRSPPAAIRHVTDGQQRSAPNRLKVLP